MGYIWQCRDWPEFRWDDSRLLGLLARVNEHHGRLAGQMSMLGFQERTGAIVDAICGDLLGSWAVEGLTLDARSVRSSVARRLGIDMAGAVAEDHYVEGLAEVSTDAVYQCREPLTASRLKDWHCALFPTGRSGMTRITVGDWRKGDEAMQVVSGAMGKERVHFTAPPTAQVDREMALMLRWAGESEVNDVLKAGILSFWMVTIHPFDDGNGRLSRMVADMFLARAWGAGERYFSMSAEIERRKKEYYKALESAQQGNCDLTEWLEWFLSCLEGSISRALEAIRLTIDKAEYWDKFRDVEVNDRQRKIINRLWDGFEGKLTTSKYAKICHCSQDTALRDIRDLMAKGMLRDSGERGRNANYLLP